MKNFQPTQAMIDAARNVFVAMAAVGAIKSIVRAYQRVILAEGQWRERPLPPSSRMRSTDRTEPQVIHDPEYAWLMSEEDFAVYDSFCKTAREMAGLYVENEDHCPLLVAESTLVDAQHKLVEVMEPVTNITANRLFASAGGMDKYKEYIDLTLKLLGRYVEGDHDPCRFVRCEEANVGMLRSLGVHCGPYDAARGGVNAIFSSMAMEKVKAFPADFRMEPLAKPSAPEVQQAPAVPSPSSNNLEP